MVMVVITKEKKTNDFRWVVDDAGSQFLQQCTITTNHETGELISKKWRDIPKITAEQCFKELQEEKIMDTKEYNTASITIGDKTTEIPIVDNYIQPKFTVNDNSVLDMPKIEVEYKQLPTPPHMVNEYLQDCKKAKDRLSSFYKKYQFVLKYFISEMDIILIKNCVDAYIKRVKE